jgi:TRAP-type C4-dicarboxylate transport system permease small subunit
MMGSEAPMSVFWKIYDRIELVLALALLAATVLAVLLTAIGRSIGTPITSGPQFAQLFLIWTCMVGADLTAKHGEHIRVSALPDILPVPLRRWVAGFNLLLMLVFLGFVAKLGFDLSVGNWQRTLGASGLSYGLVTLALPVGSALLAISLLRRAWARGLIASYEPTQEAKEGVL